MSDMTTRTAEPPASVRLPGLSAQAPPRSPAGGRRVGRRIDNWRPEDPAFWVAGHAHHLADGTGGFRPVAVPFAVATIGGRNWTILSGLMLLIPVGATAIVLQPGVSYSTLLVVAALAGVGGGNFASSMANINSFFPQRLKGAALGLNAGGGNIGVAAVQLVGLAVLATAGKEASPLARRSRRSFPRISGGPRWSMASRWSIQCGWRT